MKKNYDEKYESIINFIQIIKVVLVGIMLVIRGLDPVTVTANAFILIAGKLPLEEIWMVILYVKNVSIQIKQPNNVRYENMNIRSLHLLSGMVNAPHSRWA
jgi:hypothetical protein